MDNQEQLRDRLKELGNRFSADPEPARKKLAELLVSDPPAFRAAALALLPKAAAYPARKCLLELMLKGGLLPACDPALSELEDELALTRELLELDPQLDMKLARRLSGASADAVPDEVIQRALVLLHSIPENPRVLPMVIKLLRHPNPYVRSKAALVIGRVSKTPQVIEELLAEPNPRVRANAIEALWGMDSAKARAVLFEGAEDPNNRVVGNALLGLYRLGDTVAIPRILKMAEDPRPEFRTTAAWIMEQTGCPRFLPVLAQMVRESDPSARTWVFRAITKLKRTASAIAGLAPLRVHVTEASVLGHMRTLRAVIASEAGFEIPRLAGTAIVLWEDASVVSDYSVRPSRRPASMALSLVLPSGEAGDRVLASLSPLKREQDRWENCRYTDTTPTAALEQAFAFLETASADRHMIFAAPAPPTDPPEAALWAPVVARGRAASISAQIISDARSDPDQVPSACQKAYLKLLCGYEISSRESADSKPSELKLEVYTGQAYGVDVLKPA